MNKNGLYCFFIVFFMTICVLLSGGMFFVQQPKPRANEILTAKPLLKLPDGHVNKAYLQDVTNYVGDHFAFRANLITAHNAMLSHFFHTSASKDVVLGKEGWLYYKQTENDYLGKNVMTEQQIENVAHTLHMIQQYVTQNGSQFLFFIAPNKNSLYGEYMPYSAHIFSEQSNAENLIAELQKQDVNYIDFFTIFGQKEEILYHKWDTHWNNKGAALARDSIMRDLGIEDGLQWYDESCSIIKNHKGDLYEMLYPMGKQLDDNVIFERDFYYTADNEIHSAEDIQIDTTNESKEHSLLLFRDSFGNALYPFLADSFGHSRFSRKMPYTITMMNELGADVVLIEIVERNIANLAKYAPVFPSPEVELDITQMTQCDANIELQQSDMEGYCCMKGSVSEYGAVYIQWQDKYYEAFPVGDAEGQAFTAYVPEGTETDLKAVFVQSRIES